MAAPERVKNTMKRLGLSGVNKAKRTPNHPTKSHVVMAKEGDKRTEKDLREEYFDGPASDTMSFEEFLIKQGHGDKVKPVKMAGGCEVYSVRGDMSYYKDLM